MMRYPFVLSFIFFYITLIISTSHLYCQTLDGKVVYIDTTIYLKDCRIDSIVFNKKLQQNDTFSYCLYSQKLIYREIENDSLYDIQTDLLKNGSLINGKKYGVWNFNDNYGNKSDYCWEQITSSHPYFYFCDYRIGSIYDISNFSYNNERDSLWANFNLYRVEKPIDSLKLICFETVDENFECVLKSSSDDSIIKRFPLKYCEMELLDTDTEFDKRKKK